MRPKLKPGQNVLTLNWFYKPKLGDVIVAKIEKKLIIKRIQKVENNKYLLKGDNTSDSKDFGLITSEQIIGKVILTFAF